MTSAFTEIDALDPHGILSRVPLDRRSLLRTGLAATAVTLTGCAHPSAAATLTSSATPVPSGQPSSGPPSSAPPTSLPAVADLEELLARYLAPTPDNPQRPGYAGAVAQIWQNSEPRLTATVGHALRYTAGPVELPVSKRVAMRPDSIFDLASLTKVYVAILVLQLADQGKISLDAPVRSYLPAFSGAGKDAVTIEMLLTHTGALPVGAKVTGLPDDATRWKAVLTTPLVAGGVPGTTFRYSSVGLMVLGRLVEQFTGTTLDTALRDHLTGPLGLTDTGYRPLTWVGDKERLVATDARSSRGLLRGTVHDDVCNHLGGVAGHAGVFGTAADVAVIGQLLLNGGSYAGRQILAPATVARMLTNHNAGEDAIDAERPGRSADHGLGVVLDQPWFMGGLSSPTAFGHTGFTGTSLLVAPDHDLVVVLLTNRAHPNWSWSNPDTHRLAVHNAIAAALTPQPATTAG
jgi:CubicO group peptidase (beta-lactamase class C family)